MPWGAAIAVGGSLLSGSMQADAAKSAANAQASASDRATEEQRRQYDLTRQDQKPFQETGVAANKRLAHLLGIRDQSQSTPDVNQFIRQSVGSSYDNGYRTNYGGREASKSETIDGALANFQRGEYGDDNQALQTFGYKAPEQTEPTSGDYGSLLKRFSASDLESDPVYQSGLQFGLDQGTGAINARATQMGGYDSGATLKALTRYANDYGSTKANESYNRFNTDQSNTYNRLAGVSGAGQAATNQVQAAGTNMANNVSNLAVNAGDARAAGIVGQANAWGGALKGAVGAYQNYEDNEYLKKMLSSNSGGRGTGYGYGNQDYWDYS